ncbi:hypothetical protein Cni_G24234 [Canna indica]|uniref:PHD finger transcription factor n=1 Tax=Canna indica TaxID=4628 RepID=A0AAQ3KUX4_9LILI|nr:hypothetical protein Cni_G24234 [Canna indica]
MAEGSGERKRRRMPCGRRKLLPGENVEVLFCDEGLKGSWHAGTIVGCRGCSRLVEYKDLFGEDECSKLKEMIPVSAAIEGRTRKNPKNYRGLIRPLPPPYSDFQNSQISYGLCVDAYVDDAWWEGVVFDREERSTNRLIFFPDQGDQQIVAVDHLRLTQDWDETSDNWKPRGEWLLLQVLEPFEKGDVLPVSIRELWYDLSAMASFKEKVGLWMFGTRSVWDHLVSGLIKELLSVVHGISEVYCHQSFDFPTTFGNDEMGRVPHLEVSHVQSGNSSKWNRAKQKYGFEVSDVEVYKKTPGKENLDSNVYRSASIHKRIEPEYCPEAVVNYMRHIESSQEEGNTKIPKQDVERMKLLAQKHLLYMGWSFYERRKRLRYSSPDGKAFHSLYTASEACLNKEDNTSKTITDYIRDSHVSQNSKCLSVSSVEFKESDEVTNNNSDRSIIVPNSLECGEGSDYLHLRKFNPIPCRLPIFSQKFSKRNTEDLNSKCNEPGDAGVQLERQSSERCRQAAVTYPTRKVEEATLSMLIDNHIVLTRQKVHYISKGGHRMVEGRITRFGIQCKCCRKLHSVCGFEAHAGSNKCTPGAKTFLLDGRSIMQCQLELVYGKDPTKSTHPRLKHVLTQSQSDSICTVCHYGGTLILCDHCPSAFHLGCVGLKDVPEEKWFCPSCQCGLCGSSEFNPSENFTEKTMLYCDQCEREYHVGCLIEKGMALTCPNGKWFCSNKCSKIFHDLNNLIGKSNPTRQTGLSWTILRSKRETDGDFEKHDFETALRYRKKLHLAQKLLHECFVTIIEPTTQSDLLSDLLMNKESELNRLNFGGFYTILLEQGDEVVSVATFRVYGEKIAEIPLIATRADYRRQGMCHILLGELEKLLAQLGVERLCIPAVPTLLDTWTNSFGFKKMSSCDRLDILEYTLLNFQDTIMCQKLV